jgi:hypothetical protein
MPPVTCSPQPGHDFAGDEEHPSLALGVEDREVCLRAGGDPVGRGVAALDGDRFVEIDHLRDACPGAHPRVNAGGHLDHIVVAGRIHGGLDRRIRTPAQTHMQFAGRRSEDWRGMDAQRPQQGDGDAGANGRRACNERESHGNASSVIVDPIGKSMSVSATAASRATLYAGRLARARDLVMTTTSKVEPIRSVSRTTPGGSRPGDRPYER